MTIWPTCSRECSNVDLSSCAETCEPAAFIRYWLLQKKHTHKKVSSGHKFSLRIQDRMDPWKSSRVYSQHHDRKCVALPRYFPSTASTMLQSSFPSLGQIVCFPFPESPHARKGQISWKFGSCKPTTARASAGNVFTRYSAEIPNGAVCVACGASTSGSGWSCIEASVDIPFFIACCGSLHDTSYIRR